MSCFTNVQRKIAPGMPSGTDLSFLQQAISEIIAQWKSSKKGSFILVGQKRGELAQEILRFNLYDGQVHGLKNNDDQCFGLYATTSDRAAETAIDEILHYPRENLSCNFRPNPVNFGQLPSDIYRTGDPRAYVAVINTTLGRFLASAFTNKNGLDIQILTGVALGIRYCGRPTDRVMVASTDHIASNSSLDGSAKQRISAILDLIAPNFDTSPDRVFFE